jgi:hypothetical protein
MVEKAIGYHLNVHKLELFLVIGLLVENALRAVG